MFSASFRTSSVADFWRLHPLAPVATTINATAVVVAILIRSSPDLHKAIDRPNLLVVGGLTAASAAAG
jgi:hypothetical protein